MSAKSTILDLTNRMSQVIIGQEQVVERLLPGVGDHGMFDIVITRQPSGLYALYPVVCE
jgi:hypothetical protein